MFRCGLFCGVVTPLYLPHLVYPVYIIRERFSSLQGPLRYFTLSFHTYFGANSAAAGSPILHLVLDWGCHVSMIPGVHDRHLGSVRRLGRWGRYDGRAAWPQTAPPARLLSVRMRASSSAASAIAGTRRRRPAYEALTSKPPEPKLQHNSIPPRSLAVCVLSVSRYPPLGGYKPCVV